MVVSDVLKESNRYHEKSITNRPINEGEIRKNSFVRYDPKQISIDIINQNARYIKLINIVKSWLLK